ncbi:MAG: DUF6916 family protein [Gammaproteobacteria bacterium]
MTSPLPDYAALSALLHHEFTVRLPESPDTELPTLTMTECTRTTRPPTDAISIIFQGARVLLLPQASYELSHPDLGSFLVLIVPVGEGETHFEYQCIINRLVEGD